MKASAKKAEKAAIQQVVAGAELAEVRCRELSARLADHLEPVGHVGMRPEISIDVGIASPIQVGELLVIARVELTGMVKAKVDGEEREFPLVTVTTVFALRYEVPKSMTITEDVAHEFASGNGLFNAWPFLREALHDGTRRLGLDPFTLPLLRLRPAPVREARASATKRKR